MARKLKYSQKYDVFYELEEPLACTFLWTKLATLLLSMPYVTNDFLMKLTIWTWATCDVTRREIFTSCPVSWSFLESWKTFVRHPVSYVITKSDNNKILIFSLYFMFYWENSILTFSLSFHFQYFLLVWSWYNT